MSRKSRVTADITLEAHNILREYCGKHERSKGYLLEKMIRRYCAEIEVNQPVVKVTSIKRSAPKQYPTNLEDQFNLLWDIKGKKGAKQKAFTSYKALFEADTNETCEAATQIFMDDIIACKHEIGMSELHLTTYLNQRRWEK